MPRGKKAANVSAGQPTTAFTDTSAEPPKTNVPPALIAKALKDMLDFDTEIASLAGLKGAAIKRYEEQGVDRELLAALNRLGRKKQDEAMAYITGLTQYAVAAEVLPPRADDRWTMSVQQADMFVPASGDVADELRMARAKRQGWQAGKKGHALESNPYSASPGSPEFVGWRDGHGEGTKLRAQIKPGSENVTQATGKPTRRARRSEAADTPPAEKTQKEKDDDAYRAKGTANLHDGPITPQ